MCFRRLILIALLVCASILPQGASAGQARIIGDPMRDVLQTMQARKALEDDPNLAGHNIGVIVRDRVAILWGPVESAEIAFRAELCLRTMIELAQIRNDLFVTESIEPIRRRLKIEQPPRFVPDLLPPTLPTESRLPPEAPGHLTGHDTTVSKQPASKTTSARPMDYKDLPPIMLPIPGSSQSEGLADADQRLIDGVRKVLQSKDAFRPVLFAVKEGRIYLKCAGPDTGILDEAAQAVSRLPNVAGVVLVEKSPPR